MSSIIPHKTYWGLMARFSVVPITLVVAELLYQYHVLTAQNFGLSLVRGFGFAGATLIGCALFSSALFKWFPRMARHWRIRRYFGVSGVLCITIHVAFAYGFFYQWNLRNAYFSFNPIENPIVWGSLAFPIFLAMALTSTDWAMQKLTPRRWKRLHRCVYVAYVLAILHFVTINPSELFSLPGYLLLAITAFALFGQIFWFFKITSQKHKNRL